jgi:hypothetical protein
VFGWGKYHGTVAEISGVSNILVLVQEVLQEGDTTIEVHVDLISELLLSLNGGHHGGHGASVGGGEILVLGVLALLAELLIEIETNVEVEIISLVVLVDE